MEDDCVVRKALSLDKSSMSSTKTYSKHAEESEYEHHLQFYNAGINAPKIVSWDPDTETLTTELIPSTDIIGTLRLELPRPETSALAVKLVQEVERLHKLGYQHGDLNPTNVIISGDEVFLIDFEFSGEIGSASVTFEEEMMDLMKLVTMLCSPYLLIVSRLMSLCEETSSSRLPFQLKEGVSYAEIIDAILS